MVGRFFETRYSIYLALFTGTHCQLLTKLSQPLNLDICMTSSLFNLLAAPTLHLLSLSLGH